MSKKNHSAPAFQTLTYSRQEVQHQPPAKPHKQLQIQNLQLHRFTKASGKTKAQRKNSIPETFKSATYPFSAAPTAAPENNESCGSHTTTTLSDKVLLQTEEEKTKILMEAREKATEILAAAETEANKIKKEIEDKARKDGLKAATIEIEERISNLDELLRRLSTTQEYCRQKHEEEMVKLALSCTRRLLNREITLDAEIITGCVRELFNESDVQGHITLLLNREDMQIINEQRSQLLNEFPQINGLTVEIGEGIERGGCIIESTMGRIDASLHSKFEELQRLLG